MRTTMTTKRWVILALVLLFAFYVWSAAGPSEATVRASVLPAPPITHTVTRHHHGTTLTITRMTGLTICPEYPNGVWAGWLTFHRADGPWPGHTWHYTYGPWSGAFCSNNQRIWSMDWGGSPDGSANGPLSWTWHPSDTKLADNDNAGDVRWRKWRSHFSFRLFGLGRDEFPWLSVLVSTGANISMDDGCGC